MKTLSSKVFLSVAALATTWILGSAMASAQAQGDRRPAEQVFKNVQALKGIPADEFMATMGFFSASLGLSCGDVTPRRAAANGQNMPTIATKNAGPGG